MSRQFHEVANIFPLMQGDEFAALKADIAENGQREPIWVHPNGSIIDGRNRYRACMELDIQPVLRTWDGKGSLVAFVVSLNLHRRHLTPMQRAIIAEEISLMLGVEAKERQGRRTDLHPVTAGVDLFGDDFVEKIPQSVEKSRSQAAEIMGVNDRYVQDAKRYKEQAPEIYEMAKAGTINGSAAKQLSNIDAPRRASVLSDLKERGVSEIGGREVRQSLRTVSQQEKTQAPPLPRNKYRVWYADPPWSYGNSGVINDSDSYGRAERHYPTMTIDELCEMGAQIREAAEDNAVLFMWVTSPLLEECFPVIKAWGFKYKTSFVWDKIGHNYGHYNSVRHEFLLVCTRGSCTPDNKKLYDSVLRIDKSNTHSEKPAEARAMIDDLYTWGNRIELFARRSAEGWDRWGNE